MESRRDHEPSDAVATSDAAQTRGNEGVCQRGRHKDLAVGIHLDGRPVAGPRGVSFSRSSLRTANGKERADKVAEKPFESASDLAGEVMSKRPSPNTKARNSEPKTTRRISSLRQATSTAAVLPPVSVTCREAPKKLSLCTLPNEILDMIFDYCLDNKLPSHNIDVNTSISLSSTNKQLDRHALEWYRRQELTVCVKLLLKERLAKSLPLSLLRQVEKLRLDFGGLTYRELTGDQQVLDDLKYIWRSGDTLKQVRYVAPLDYQQLNLQFDPGLPRVTAMRRVAASMELLAHGLGFEGKAQWEPDYTGAVNEFDQTAVLAALNEGKEQLVRYIADQTCDGLDTVCGGLTPLYVAVLNENVQMTKLLLETKRVNVNAVNQYRLETSLSMAVKMASHEIVRLLLETGEADITTPRGIEARTPMDTAELYYEDEMVDMLQSRLSQLHM